MKRMMIVLLVCLSLVMIPAVSQATDGEDFCAGLHGAALGLCRAAVHIGCDVDAGHPACDQIAENYERITGESPPWLQQCPVRLVLGPTNWWFETDPPFSGISEITMVVAMRNEYPYSDYLDFDYYSTDFQLWSVPTGITMPELPVVINQAPSGIVNYGDLFTYDLTIDVSGLPAEDRVLGFRVMASPGGTLNPTLTPVEQLTFTCQ